MIRSIVLASRNEHKILELRTFLDGLSVAVQGLDEFPGIGDIIEDGETFEDNARKKAREVHAATGLPTLADDSGLEVFFLNARPGVRSARYAGDDATDERNNALLLRQMKGVARRRRNARFIACLALVAPDVQQVTYGQCAGHLAESPRGTNGFGYDPIFVPDGFTRTYAELSREEKNRISHRAHAFSAMRQVLEQHTR